MRGKPGIPGLNMAKKGGSWPISRVLSWTAIHLGRWSPIASSSLPAGFGGPPVSMTLGHRRACLFGLAPSGVYLAVRVATSAVSSYLAISTLPDPSPCRSCPLQGGFAALQRQSPGHRRYLFCCTFRRLGSGFAPSTYSAQALPGTLPCGARTFLYAADRAAAAWPTPARSIRGWRANARNT
jgi:hypothetical protein